MNFKELREAADAYKAARTIQVACDLKLFDLLDGNYRSAEGIARELKLEERATELFCNALAGMGLIEKKEEKFTNGDVAQKYLVSSSPLYYGWIIRHSSHGWESWERLPEALRTGERLEWSASANDTSAAEMEAFIMGMHSIVMARGDAELLSKKLDFSNIKKMLDVGGGPATFPIVFCREHAGLAATVFDLPETVRIARKNLKNFSDVENRITLVEGNFLENELPKGFDLIFISNIIHMNSEEDNEKLFKKAFASLNKGGRIVVKDHLLNDDLTLPPYASLFSIHMLLHTNGRDYSFTEIRDLLERVGCSRTESIDLPPDTPYGVIAGIK